MASPHDKMKPLADKCTFPPVSQLPSELLADIFMLHASSSHSSQSLTAEHDSYQWIAIAHVCRRWRDIAIHMPLLWDHITHPNPKWAQLCIARSAGVPLTVRIPGDDPFLNWCPGALRLLLDNIGRFRALDLTLSDACLRFFETCERKSASMLEELCLTAPSLSERTFQAESLPFAGSLSRLRILELRDMKDLDLQQISLMIQPTLAKLILSGLLADNMNITDLFKLLFDRLPFLEHLEVTNANQRSEQPPTHSKATLHFPRLQTIRLSDVDGSMAIPILNRMVIAQDARVEVALTGTWITEHAMRDVTSAVAGMMTTRGFDETTLVCSLGCAVRDRRTLCSLEFRRDEALESGDEAQSDDEDYDERDLEPYTKDVPPQNAPSLSLSFPLERGDNDLLRATAHSYLPFHAIDTLELSSDIPNKISHILLDRMINVRHLILHGSDTIQETLRTIVGDSPASSLEDLLSYTGTQPAHTFPFLECLELRYAAEGGSLGVDAAEQIRDFLRTRMIQALPVPRLVLACEKSFVKRYINRFRLRALGVQEVEVVCDDFVH